MGLFLYYRLFVYQKLLRISLNLALLGLLSYIWLRVSILVGYTIQIYELNVLPQRDTLNWECAKHILCAMRNPLRIISVI